ncbi:choline ethanolamine kinase [Fusarium beomiforme]|uniref:Choline ethanolamine kinase n=1 Tax=Fusarium beomiforme TaxID=44412 RepID=A0A9P5DS66_9HYPO|nr:choline ethanolamine kinase [Fusarium beomiforme]
MITLKALGVSLPRDKVPTNHIAREIIVTFFTKEWPHQDSGSLTVTFNTSFTNPSCVVTRPQPSNCDAVEPLKLFIKFQHPDHHTIAALEHLAPTKTEEALLTYEYGRSGFGAQVYGLFQTKDGTIGRIGEFLDARHLEPTDVEHETIRADIAKSLATFHTLRVPLPKKPVSQYYDAIHNGLHTYHKSDRLKIFAKENGMDISDLVDYDFILRCQKVTSQLQSINAEAGWCIHDVQFMNVLVENRPKHGECQVRLIDFELVFWNYRAFDIGAHFMHKMFKWFDPVDKIAPCRPYLDEEKQHFCDVYARRWSERTGEACTGAQVFQEAELAYMLAIAFDIHNMLWFMDARIDDQGALAMVPAMNQLLKNFKDQYIKLELEDILIK